MNNPLQTVNDMRVFPELSFQNDEHLLREWINETINNLASKCWEVNQCNEESCPACLKEHYASLLENDQKRLNDDSFYEVEVAPGIIISRFQDYLVIYMYHCHLLEHEDNGMMGQFEIVP